MSGDPASPATSFACSDHTLFTVTDCPVNDIVKSSNSFIETILFSFELFTYNLKYLYAVLGVLTLNETSANGAHELAVLLPPVVSRFTYVVGAAAVAPCNCHEVG